MSTQIKVFEYLRFSSMSVPERLDFQWTEQVGNLTLGTDCSFPEI